MNFTISDFNLIIEHLNNSSAILIYYIFFTLNYILVFFRPFWYINIKNKF